MSETKEEFHKFEYDFNKKEQQNAIFGFEHDISHAIKVYTFVIVIKKKTFGFKTQLLDETINLSHLTLVNEMFQTFRIKEYNFDVKIRIR